MLPKEKYSYIYVTYCFFSVYWWEILVKEMINENARIDYALHRRVTIVCVKYLIGFLPSGIP